MAACQLSTHLCKVTGVACRIVALEKDGQPLVSELAMAPQGAQGCYDEVDEKPLFWPWHAS